VNRRDLVIVTTDAPTDGQALVAVLVLAATATVSFIVGAMAMGWWAVFCGGAS